jgi:hypothetical protein
MNMQRKVLGFKQYKEQMHDKFQKLYASYSSSTSRYDSEVHECFDSLLTYLSSFHIINLTEQRALYQIVKSISQFQT